MDSADDISVNHDIEMYASEMTYYKENNLMARKYFDYISEYSRSCSNFLELGAGFGDTIELINSKYSNIVVLDAEKKLIEKFRGIYPGIRFVHSYFETFVSTQKFDNIGMGFVLDLVDDPVMLLRKYAGYLAENGRIFVSIQSASSLHRKIAYHAGILEDIKKMSKYDRMFNHKFYKTYDELTTLFEDAGLRITAAHGLFLKAFTTAQIKSLNLDDNIYSALAETARDLPEVSSGCFFVLVK